MVKRKYSISDVINAHRYNNNSKLELQRSVLCGCYNCTEVFFPSDIRDWVIDEDKKDLRPLCPFCGSRMIIGDCSGYPIKKDFLQEMKKYAGV